jgi:hypothetical protein
MPRSLISFKFPLAVFCYLFPSLVVLDLLLAAMKKRILVAHWAEVPVDSIPYAISLELELRYSLPAEFIKPWAYPQVTFDIFIVREGVTNFVFDIVQ